MRHLFRPSSNALLPSLAAIGAMLVLAGCPKAPPLEKQTTRAYLLSVREAAAEGDGSTTAPDSSAASGESGGTPAQEVRLYAIELEGTLSAGAATEAVSIPAGAAPLDESAPERPRTLYRIASEGERLRVEELAGRDLLLTVAEPREEVISDLYLLAEIQKLQAGSSGAPVISTAELGALASLTSEKQLKRVADAAEEEERVSALQNQLDLTSSTATQVEGRLAALNEEREELMSAVLDAADNDLESTREQRLRIAEIDLEISELTKYDVVMKARSESELQLEAGRENLLSKDELDELRELVDQAIKEVGGEAK